MLFDDALHRHLRALKTEGLAEATTDNHKNELRLFHRWLVDSGLDWHTVHEHQLAEHLAVFARTHSPARTRNYRIVVTKFYERAERCRWIERSPLPQRRGTLRVLASRGGLGDESLSRAIDEFGDDQLRRGLSDLTVENYGRMLQQFGGYLPRLNKHWQEATLHDLECYLRVYRLSRSGRAATSKRYAGQRSNSTVSLMTTCLRAFYGWAARMGYVAVSPAADLEPVKRDRPLPRHLQPALVRQLLQKLHEPPRDLSDEEREEWLRNRLIVVFLLFTGVRLSSCARARWEDIDTERRWWRVLVKGNKELMIPLHPYLVRELLVYQQHLGVSSGPLFISRRGEGLSDEGISEMFRRFVQGRLGIPVTAHQLRHTFATTLLDEGGQVEAIQPVLGHENIRTTMIYARIANKKLHQLVELLPQSWQLSFPEVSAEQMDSPQKCCDDGHASQSFSKEQKEDDGIVALPTQSGETAPRLGWLALLMLVGRAA
jgi:site-specific recombinase XerD